MNSGRDIEQECGLVVERLCLAFGRRLVAVALYGSAARGEARPGSDLDILLIAHRLPEHPLRRAESLAEALSGAGGGPRVLAYTPEEFESRFPSIYLDLGLDARVLHDPEGYLEPKLARIREIIDEANLERVRDGRWFSWRWKGRWPRGYEITWDGFRDLGWPTMGGDDKSADTSGGEEGKSA